jgi:hypothetical protein
VTLLLRLVGSGILLSPAAWLAYRLIREAHDETRMSVEDFTRTRSALAPRRPGAR